MSKLIVVMWREQLAETPCTSAQRGDRARDEDRLRTAAWLCHWCQHGKVFFKDFFVFACIHASLNSDQYTSSYLLEAPP